MRERPGIFLPVALDSSAYGHRAGVKSKEEDSLGVSLLARPATEKVSMSKIFEKTLLVSLSV